MFGTKGRKSLIWPMKPTKYPDQPTATADAPTAYSRISAQPTIHAINSPITA